ncbi:MAG: helix-turn-helix domain-containing protein [Ruminococcus sp.]|nr:helix-turn-helix domain-containing protein [Ruminococcus sp.]MCM1380771.1 helix-turn-helix domain-containing protein [Muribaculaceae bacterium]MCM1478452.1 helix-turn-helix domain-containing protein [Muribaculaceae bacterium]
MEYFSCLIYQNPSKQSYNNAKGQKISQKKFAEKCELHATYIGQIERGEKNATIESISKIVAGLSVSMSTLFEKLDISGDGKPNYPLSAYELVQSVPENVQEKLISILKTIVSIE